MRPGLVVVAAVAAAAAAVGLAGSAGAQDVGVIVVAPAQADPGGTVVVSNGPSSPCLPVGAANPSASVDLYAVGSATPSNRVPHLGVVTPLGAWSVEVRLAPDLPPGPYRVQAGCYTDSGLNAGYGPAYEPGRLEVRQQVLGPPRPSISAGRPGDAFQVTSGGAPCVPPPGAASPRVRVSLLDAAQATRAEAESTVDPASGRWSVNLSVPAIDAQDASVTAVCLARVGASVPYARYESARLRIEQLPAVTTTTTVASPPGPGPVTVPAVPGETTTSVPAPGPVAELPVTPLARAVVAEPTYTG